MKTLGIVALAILALLVTVAAPVSAQITPSYQSLAKAKTFANNQNDTLPANPVNDPTGATSGLRLASASLLSTYFSATDSVEVIRYFQYRPFGSGTWATLYADSTTNLNGTAAAPTVDEDMLRSTALDRWTYAYGFRGYVRLVCVFGPTKNGTAGTTTYDAGFTWRP